MGKRVIRLTEADIEKIVKKVIKEQGSGDLTGVQKRKKVKIESSSDWRGADEGTLNFDIVDTNYQAVNVGYEKFKIAMHNDVAKVGKELPGESTPPTEGGTRDIADFEIKGSELPYADNMVTPDFDKYPDAKTLFNNIVTSFVDYIKAGGGSKLTNVTIKGSADSAAPNENIPSGYNKLDHPGGKLFGGIPKENLKERNQWLADNRASEYAKLLKNSISEQSGGFELKINVLPGDNYYGKGNEFRGEEYRKITLTPNAEPLKLNTPSPTNTPGSQTSGSKVKFPSRPYGVEYYWDGQGGTVSGYEVFDSRGNRFLAISKEDSEKWGTPIFDGKLNASIKGDKFYVDNKLVGQIQPSGTAPREFFKMGNKFQYWVGPITNVRAYRNTDIEGEGTVTVAYLDQAYFLFY